MNFEQQSNIWISDMATISIYWLHCETKFRKWKFGEWTPDCFEVETTESGLGLIPSAPVFEICSKKRLSSNSASDDGYFVKNIYVQFIGLALTWYKETNTFNLSYLWLYQYLYSLQIDIQQFQFMLFLKILQNRIQLLNKHKMDRSFWCQNMLKLNRYFFSSSVRNISVFKQESIGILHK